MAARKLTRQDLRDAAEKFKNWGRWGPNDEIGTLNYTQPQDIVAAARLVRKGKVISLALNFDHHGPQGAKSKYPAMGRINPLHTMLRTGTDAYSGVLDHRGIRAADDMVVMPLQCGTQWDGLGHVFYENHMWNGYDCREVTSAGAQKLNDAVLKAVQAPDFRQRIDAAGFEPTAVPLRETADYLRGELVKWAKVVKDTGAKVD